MLNTTSSFRYIHTALKVSLCGQHMQSIPLLVLILGGNRIKAFGQEGMLVDVEC